MENREEPGDRSDRGDRRGAVRGLARDRHGLPAEGQGAVPRSLRLKVAGSAAALVAGLLIGGCAYLSEKQAELIFRPSKDAWRGYSAERYPFEEHWVPIGEGQKLHAWYLKGDRADAPVVLYLHGARWNLTGSVTRIDRWRQLGFAVFAVDYRGFGKSADVAPTEAYAYEDAQAAYDYMANAYPNRKHFIVGHSLGGAIATELAMRRPDASGLVLEATFTSVRDMISESSWGFLPVGLILTQEFNTLAKLPEVKVPVLITHGTRDSIVPYSMGERLFEAVKSPKRFIKVEGAGHHNLSGAAFEEYRQALQELFKLKG